MMYGRRITGVAKWRVDRDSRSRVRTQACVWNLTKNEDVARSVHQKTREPLELATGTMSGNALKVVVDHLRACKRIRIGMRYRQEQRGER
jgi:hypothetical protein